MGLMDRIFGRPTKNGGYKIESDGPSMGEMMSRAQGIKSSPVRAEAPRPPSIEGLSAGKLPAVSAQEAMSGRVDPSKTVNIEGGAVALGQEMARKLESADAFAQGRARDLQRQEASMPSIEDAADDEKDAVLRLDAESDAWSRIAGVFRTAGSDADPFSRLTRVKNALKGLRETNLGKGPEAEVIKFRAIEEAEKLFRG